MNRTKLTITFLICLILSAPALANMALRGKSFSSNAPDEERVELSVNQEFVDRGRDVSLSKNDVAKVVPLDLRTTNDGNAIRDKILLHSANSIVKSEMVKNSFLFKTAQKVQKSAKVDMSIKPVKTVFRPKPIEHKFNVDVQAFKKEARLTYKGYVDSRIEYKMETDSLYFLVEEKLSDNSKIAFSHQKNLREQRQLVRYQVSW